MEIFITQADHFPLNNFLFFEIKFRFVPVSIRYQLIETFDCKLPINFQLVISPRPEPISNMTLICWIMVHFIMVHFHANFPLNDNGHIHIHIHIYVLH